MQIHPDTLDAIIQAAIQNHESVPPQVEPIPLFEDWTKDGPPPMRPERLKLYELIDVLSDDDKYDLAAIAWVGRGDLSSFDEARKHAQTFPTKGTASYLSSKVPLDEYLIRGLEKLSE